MGREHHDILPFGLRVADDPVDQPGHVVSALFDVLVKRREIRVRQPADRLVVVYAEYGNVVRDAEFPPPSAFGLQTGFGDVISLIVVAGHDCDRFGQRLQPGGQLDRVVEPQVGLRRVPQRREGEFGIGPADRFAETLIAFVGPYDSAGAVECEVAESFFQEVLRAHLPGPVVGSGDVGDRREAGFEILCDGDDAVAGEQFDVVRVVELSDDGIGTHAQRPVDHGFDAEFVADGERQPAKAPGLSGVVGVACDTQQKAPGVGFGEIRQKDNACHFGALLWVKDSFFCRNGAARSAFLSAIFRGAGFLRRNVCVK